MRKRGVNREVLRLALPSILANITIPFVGMVDMAVVGHVANAVAIGGIAIGTMLFDLLYWNFGFLRVGTGGMTAQAYGRGDEREELKLLTQGLSISLGATILIWLIQWVFVEVVLALVPCTTEVADFARHYFYVRIWAAPATLSLMVFKGWFIGMQNTIAPMLCDVVVNVVNIVASVVLSLYTPLGVLGVAYGTLIAQYTGLVVAVVLLLLRYGQMLHLLSLKEFVRWKEMKQLFVLNRDLFIRSLCFMVIYIGFTSLSSQYGDELLAVSSIIMKLMMVFSYFVDGFAYAGEALVGRFIGERNRNGVVESVRILFEWTVGIGVVFTLMFGLWGADMFGWMTTDEAVRESAIPYYPWLIAMPIVSVFAFMWDGIYVGATAGREIRNCMFYSAVGFVLGYVVLQHWLGVHAVYVGYFIHLLIRDVYLTAVWKNTLNKVMNKQ